MLKNKAKRVFTQSEGTLLAQHVRHAANAFSRLRGLLGTRSLAPGHALWLRPCSSIHTLGMRYAIDALFLDKHSKVVKAAQGIRPQRLCWAPLSTRSVLELPAGVIAQTGVAIGDVLEFSP